VFTKIDLALTGGGGKGVVPWDELAQQFTLDAVGRTVLGYDFHALAGGSSFVQEYNVVMRDAADPLYIVLPFLDRWFPRKEVIRRMEALVTKFQGLLEEKKAAPGEDIMTFMLGREDMQEVELRDNMVVLFIAGHVSYGEV
jgi:cytochrome P450